MLRTYTLYLRGGEDPGRFEPALCGSQAEAMTRARDLLLQNPDCESVEVFFGETRLFEVSRA